MSIITSTSSTIPGTFHLYEASQPRSAKDQTEDDAQTELPEGKIYIYSL